MARPIKSLICSGGAAAGPVGHFASTKPQLFDQHAGTRQRSKALIDQFGGGLTQTAIVKKLLAIRVANNEVTVARQSRKMGDEIISTARTVEQWQENAGEWVQRETFMAAAGRRHG